MSNINTKYKVLTQEIINSNIISSGGDFHSDEFNVDGFIYDFKKHFSISEKTKNPKKTKNPEETIELLAESCKVNVIGRFNSKELKVSKFLNGLFDKLEITKL